MPPKPRPLAERFWAKVDKNSPTMPGMESPCWVFTGAKDPKGYGRIGIGPRGTGTALASRVSWELHNGPLGVGECALHRCDNPPCVRPDHLFRGTHADNNADMARKGRASRASKVFGETHGMAKLTDAQVLEIRSRCAERRPAFAALAAEFGVHEATIGKILRGKSWRLVRGPA